MNLVGTKLLHYIRLFNGQINTMQLLLQSLLSVFEVDICPALDVPSSSLGLVDDQGIRTCLVR